MLIILLICSYFFSCALSSKNNSCGLSTCPKKYVNGVPLIFDWNVESKSATSGPCSLWWPLNNVDLLMFDSKELVFEMEISIYCTAFNYSYTGDLLINYSALKLEFIPYKFQWQTFTVKLLSNLLGPENNFTLTVYQKPIGSVDEPILVSNFNIVFNIKDWSSIESHVEQYQPLLSIPSAHSMMLNRHREDFGYLLNNLNLLGLAVEVGVDEAVFSEQFLSRWKGQLYVMVDPWKHFPHEEYIDETNKEQRIQDEKYRISKERMAIYGSRAEFLRLTSIMAAKLMAENILDFIYIDAQHNYFDVMIDMIAWWPKLKKGGILAGHDFQLSNVRYAVIEFGRKMNHEIHLTKDSCCPSWYIFKNID